MVVTPTIATSDDSGRRFSAAQVRIEELEVRLGELRQLLPVWNRAQEDTEIIKGLEDKLDESRQSLVEAEEAEQACMLEKSFVEDKVQSLKDVVKEFETAVDLEEVLIVFPVPPSVIY